MQLLKIKKITKRKTKHKVYCVTVPSGELILGNGILIGNCNFAFLYGAVASTFAERSLLLPPPEGWNFDTAKKYFAEWNLSIGDSIQKKLSEGIIDERTSYFYACAEEIRKRFFNEYKGIAKYIDDSRAFAVQHGYVESMFGWRIFLPALKYRDMENEESAIAGLKNDAVNYPIIATEAQIMQKTMLELDKHFMKYKVDAHMINQVHDSLLIEFDKKYVDSSLGKDIHDIMCQQRPEYQGVALDAEATYAPYWGGSKDKGSPDAAKIWFE